MAKAPHAERPYETLLICSIDTPQKTVDGLIEKVKATLTAEKSTVKTVQYWGRRRLTYPIKRQKDGVYVYFDFDGTNKAAEAVNGIFRVTDFVMRHMTVLREEAPVIPVAAANPFVEGGAAAVAAPDAAAAVAQPAKETPAVKPQ